MPPRDTQRSKVYRAEDAVDHGKRFETMSELEQYVISIRRNPALRRRYEAELNMTIKVTDGRGRRRAAGNSRGIKMPQWSRTELITLHEVAHTVHSRQWQSSLQAAHGWQWAAIYLDLVRFMMGKDTADALKASFRKHKVRFAAKRKVTMTEEAKQALRQRFAAAARRKTT